MSAWTSSATEPERADPGVCGCGCGKPADQLCEFECLIRPRFYCGQLLTDQDLTAMVDWTRERFRLQRHLHGWGVACGLNVRCDPQNPAGVIVETGYAVSCCGDDIVLCADDRVDLAAACRVDGPCDDLTGWQRSEEVGGTIVETDQTAAYAMAAAFDADEAESEREEELVAIDLSIHYDEKPSDQRASLRRGGCVEAPECEPAKIIEGHRFVQTPVPADSEPAHPDVKRWCLGYDRCLEVLRRWPHQWDPAAQRDWLVRWLDEHPPVVFCELRHQLCALGEYPNRRRLMGLLLRVVLDCRIAHIRRGCRTCRRTEGVPLARIYLRRTPDGSDCRVAYIDGFAPFRRSLSLDPALPAPAGMVNVGELIGARLSQARATLDELGVSVRIRRLDPGSVEGVGQMYDALYCECGVLVRRGRTAELAIVSDGDDGWSDDRIVGICRAEDGGSEPGRSSGEDWDESSDEADQPVSKVDPVSALQEISGVGPKIAEALAADGITVAQVAAMGQDELRRWLPALHHGRAAEIIRSAVDLVEGSGGS